MAEKINFNKRAIEALEPPASGRRYVYDTRTPNLQVCITQAGSRTFLRYGKVKGKPERTIIGRFPAVTVSQARDTCKDMSGRIVRGEVPQEKRRRGGLTLKQLFKLYLERYAKAHKRTWKHDDYQFGKYLAEWHERKVADVTKADVQELHVRIGDDIGKTTANRVRSLLSKLYSFALENDIHDANPCVGVRKFRERSRDRYLQPDELPRLFAKLDAEPNQTFADFVRLSLFVGARRANMLAMRWDEVSIARREWRIPETKAGESQLVPLPLAAVEILERRQQNANGSPWVFPSRSKSGHLESPRKAWLRLCERAGIEGLTIHDLRRSLGSWQAAAGASELIIGKTLGHAPGSKATSVYARLNLDSVRQSVEVATAAMIAAAATKPDD